MCSSWGMFFMLHMEQGPNLPSQMSATDLSWKLVRDWGSETSHNSMNQCMWNYMPRAMAMRSEWENACVWKDTCTSWQCIWWCVHVFFINVYNTHTYITHNVFCVKDIQNTYPHARLHIPYEWLRVLGCEVHDDSQLVRKVSSGGVFLHCLFYECCTYIQMDLCIHTIFSYSINTKL